MGVTITHDPWADGEYLKFAIGATAITATNAPPLAVSEVGLSCSKVAPTLC